VRLFVAVELAEEVARAAGALIDELRRRAQQLAPRSRITWVAPDRLHLTLAFIGPADERRAELIGGALAPAVDLAPFDLTVSGTGAFPRAGEPRVLWAGLSAGRDGLLQLEEVVARRLAGSGVPQQEQRVYNPHLTLARVRDAAGLRSARLLTGLTDAVVGTTRVDTITLFNSQLSSKGPTYVPLQRTRLGSG
jgi:2'-5' RNA ligase